MRIRERKIACAALRAFYLDKNGRMAPTIGTKKSIDFGALQAISDGGNNPIQSLFTALDPSHTGGEPDRSCFIAIKLAELSVFTP